MAQQGTRFKGLNGLIQVRSSVGQALLQCFCSRFPAPDFLLPTFRFDCDVLPVTGGAGLSQAKFHGLGLRAAEPGARAVRSGLVGSDSDLILGSSPRIGRGVGRRQSLQGIASHPAEAPLGEHFGPVTAVELDGGRVPIEDRPFEATTTPFQGQ